MRQSVVADFDVNSLYSDVSNSETDTGYTWSNVESVDSPGKRLCYSRHCYIHLGDSVSV